MVKDDKERKECSKSECINRFSGEHHKGFIVLHAAETERIRGHPLPENATDCCRTVAGVIKTLKISMSKKMLCVICHRVCSAHNSSNCLR